jgi:hypothetical protein
MKIIRNICRYIIGTVFIFSGTVKAIDPLGTVYKFQDYFQAFHIGFLRELSLPLTILLCTLEFIAGFSLFFNLRQRTGLLIVLLLMFVFTPLTFILALTNPVSDCGCFGDAIHLTNWQTFLKNIFLLIPAIYLFVSRKEITPEAGKISSWIKLAITSVIFILFIFYNLRYLPVIDFLPYKTGTYIPDKMKIPEGSRGDTYKTTFIYGKNGIKKEFSLENYPSNDSTWKFIDQKSIIVAKGYQPPIHDFSIRNVNKEDITQQILTSDKPTLLIISKKLKEADPDLLRIGFNHGYYCMGNMIDIYFVTASGSDEVRGYSNGIPFCFADETTLKTMVRSNPGYILLRKGKIIGKWSWANMPDNNKLSEYINQR